MITTEILDNPDLIDDACALLYTVNIEDGRWNFVENNPSQLRVEIKNGRKLLVDRFKDRSTWFGAFKNNKLIGCTRLSVVDENNLFEMEGYPSSKTVWQHLPIDKRFCVESTRTAVIKDYVGLGVAKLLLLEAFKYCEKNRFSVMGCASNGYLKLLLKRIGYPLIKEHAFKYEPQDPSPVNFYFADYNKAEVKNMITVLEVGNKNKLKVDSNAIFLDLERITPILPTPVYWHDTVGVVLGVNEHCLRGMGATRDIIGKTPYDFYSKEIAEHILTHNAQVIKSGEILSQDERIEDITTGEVKYFRNTKAPLYDEEGKIVGIIGSAIEVTAEKEAERLKIENEAQNAIVKSQQEFKKAVGQMIHDITSPIQSIENIITRLGSAIPEEDRITLRNATERISGISGNLLNKYKNKDEENGEQAVLVALALIQTMNEKREEFKDSQITFELDLKESTHFVVIKIDLGMFKRMISNLVNNAVDALKGRTNGKIMVSLYATDKDIAIFVKDNGCGMPAHIQEKFKQGLAITSGKENGHGLGLVQVHDTIKAGGGCYDIWARENINTDIVINFPRIVAPRWLASEIKLTKNDTVIILDDDKSIHGSWDRTFADFMVKVPSLQIKHFTEGAAVVEYVNSLASKQNIFLLVDYELLGQKLTGLDVVEQTGITRALLVTSYATHADKQTAVMEMGIKLLPKELAHIVSLKLDKQVEPWSRVVDMVWLEDQQCFVESLIRQHYKHLKIDIYYDPVSFREDIYQYPLNTQIILDMYYEVSAGTRYKTDGIILAQELYAMGYTNLVLFTAEMPERGTPAYLKVILKTDTIASAKLDKIFAAI